MVGLISPPRKVNMIILGIPIHRKYNKLVLKIVLSILLILIIGVLL